MRIIAIDDQQAVGTVIEALSDVRSDLSVRFTTNPHVGLTWIRNGEADIVLTDIDMPELDGWTVISEVRKIDPLLPVVALTGAHSEVDMEVRCLQAGARYFLNKPFRLARLLAVLDALYDHTQKVREQTQELNQVTAAKEELSLREEKFRNLINNLPDQTFFYVHDKEGIFTYLSPTVERVLGYSVEEFSTYCDAYLTDHAINALALAHSQGSLRGERQPPYRVEIRHKQGHGVMLELVEAPVSDLDGRVVAVEGIAHDVTEQLKLEEEREAYHQAMQHSRQPTLITDLWGDILHANPSFCRMYGYDEEEVRGMNPRLLNPGREAYRQLGYDDVAYDDLFKGLWQAISNPAEGFWEGDLPNSTRGGKIIWVHLIVSAIRNAQGHPIAYLGMPIDLTERREMERSVRIECYHALAELAEKRDQETGAHLKRLSAYVGFLCEELNLPGKMQEDLQIFIPLHDIGKVGIADAILHAPRRLTADEFEVMKTHAAIGGEILSGRSTLELAAEIARHHHERWDGTGYPDGLAGEAIPLCARLAAICDVYDALRSRRPYKEPWTHEQACEEITNGRGTHFDPELVSAFLKQHEKFDKAFHALADEDEADALPGSAQN